MDQLICQASTYPIETCPTHTPLKVFVTECSEYAQGRCYAYISKMYISHWEPPEVSERRRRVNLEVSISGANQTLGGHSGQAIGVTGISDDWYRSTMGAVVRILEAPGTVTQPMRESQTNSERSRVLRDIHLKDCRRYLSVHE
jgi:hypothetical protein